jgi:RNA polymerase subunit RPABC4/transcription elongation factor Spt4
MAMRALHKARLHCCMLVTTNGDICAVCRSSHSPGAVVVVVVVVVV